jgi:hypothetical protein
MSKEDHHTHTHTQTHTLLAQLRPVSHTGWFVTYGVSEQKAAKIMDYEQNFANDHDFIFLN